MDPIDFDALPDAPYRLPSRHPAAGRGMSRLRDADDDLPAEASSTPPAALPDLASEIKRRQESLMLSYIIHRPGRY